MIKQNIDDLIDGILRIVGLISLLRGVVAMLFQPSGYSAIVKMKKIYSMEELEALDINSAIECEVDNLSNEIFVLIPEGTNIHRVQIEAVQYVSFLKRMFARKVLYKYKNIFNRTALAVRVYSTEGIPMYRIRWELPNGLEAMYYFTANGYNGYENAEEIEYRKTIKYIVYRMIGII